MPPASYLTRLAFELVQRLGQTPEALRVHQLEYVLRCQNADGGFSGREGESDVYYAGFALRTLALLGGLEGAVLDRAADYLRKQLHPSASLVEFFSTLYCGWLLLTFDGPDILSEGAADWRDPSVAELARFRTSDGGFANSLPSPTAAAGGSTYHTFLAVLCHELIERPPLHPEAIIRFIQSRQREDGGYVEIAAMRRSGTNPTAAAIGTLRCLEAQGHATRSESSDAATAAFLLGMASPEGGLRANSRVPLADLLSTFTGLWTLHDLGALDRVDRAAAKRYVEALAMPGGGFRAGLWDDRADVEYTFYGLGALALLQPEPPAGPS
jgi:geranylgeranyl transferase type-2 subunit beta